VSEGSREELPTAPGLNTRVRRRAHLPPWALFPALVSASVLLLTVLQLNGSSVARLEPGWKSDPNLIAGAPRSIRTDEFKISTPVQVGNVAKGYPADVWLGLNDIKLGATSLDAPVRDWTTVFRPQTWGLLIVGRGGTAALETGFAWSWWLPLASGLLGVYALLMALRPRPLFAAALATVIALAPYVAWWSGASAGTTLGFVTGAGAALITSLRARSGPRAVLWALAASWLAIAAYLALYPPWLISIGILVSLVVAGAALDIGVRGGRLLLAAGAFVPPMCIALVVWFEQNKNAITAITGTYYPGQRRSTSGQGIWADLLSAPLNFNLSFQPASLNLTPGAEGNTNNLSEVSSVWLPLPVLLLLIVLVLVGIRHGATAKNEGEERSRQAEPKWRLSAIGAAIGFVVLIGWAMAPLPAAVGALVLDRVPGFRTYFAIGLAFVIIVHLAAGRVRLRGRAAIGWGSLTVAASAALTGAVVPQIVRPTPSAVFGPVVVSCSVAALALLAVFSRRRAAWAVLGLAAIAVSSFAVVEPLYRGLGPLVSSPIAQYLRSRAAIEGPTRWVDLSRRAQAVIVASQDSLISGMTYYPSREIWDRLAPKQERIWNNYNEVIWAQDPLAGPAVLTQSKRVGVVNLSIDLCSPQVAFLDITYVVTPPKYASLAACFTPVAEIDDLGTRLTIWRRTAPATP
jgi:hypothetical protein